MKHIVVDGKEIAPSKIPCVGDHCGEQPNAGQVPVDRRVATGFPFLPPQFCRKNSLVVKDMANRVLDKTCQMH